MSKSEYSTEDFVLDPDFRKWVLENDSESKTYWVEFLAQYPSKVKEIKEARELLIHLSRQKVSLSSSKEAELFAKINQAIEKQESGDKVDATLMVDLDSWSTIQKYNLERERQKRKHLKIRIGVLSGLLLAVVGLFFLPEIKNDPLEQEVKVEWVSFAAPAGVKSSISLEDGSKVHLNSGSKITYPKSFVGGIREIRLEGEAFFEVAKNPEMPFVVRTKHLVTTALGTSFNINAYPEHEIAVSLVSGKVRVEDSQNESNQAILNPGETIKSDLESKSWEKGNFEQEDILAWLNKTLVFEKTSVQEAILMLENWYGVNFEIQGTIPINTTVSGKFKDETLQNILEGLSYSARFNYKINGKTVNLTFKP
ncbi:FecR family protein [Algoriphagus sp.]|uniref:FecR family protein n=1 Tax=Algoriphagus sp. TaxID=1872435 RepID=UPI002602A253|nr:FecR family protein [Algoriphagus sp.]